MYHALTRSLLAFMFPHPSNSVCSSSTEVISLNSPFPVVGEFVWIDLISRPYRCAVVNFGLDGKHGATPQFSYQPKVSLPRATQELMLTHISCVGAVDFCCISQKHENLGSPRGSYAWRSCGDDRAAI